MKVLSIDTATECASCAVLDDDKLLGEISFNYKKQHSVILMSMIDNLLNNLGLNVNSLDGFVVSKGPGSFTGLRIGVSAIKGFSQGTSKPFVGISSLDSLAYNLAYTTGIICPILDALRNNVYTALYKFEGANLKIISEHTIMSIDDLIVELNNRQEPVCFIGDAVPKFKEKLTSGIENVSFAPTHLNLTRASSLGELGLKLLEAETYDDLYTFAPLYLRKSQAEREYEKKVRGTENE